MPALAAAFVMPGVLERDFFLAAILGFDFDIRLGHTLHFPLTFSFELEDDVVEIFGGRLLGIADELAIFGLTDQSFTG
jgi:hypothetical protein